MKKHECDVLLIGGGITAAQMASRLVQKKPGLRVTIVEAGRRFFNFDERAARRERWLAYGENPWSHDFIEDQSAEGIISRSMAVGGSAMHWGGVTNRFSEEDTRLHSRFGLATDWPIEWAELERYYCDAERQLGVSGEPSPIAEEKRSAPYPMPPMLLSHNLKVLKAWADKSGLPFGSTPQAKNTREYDGRGVCKRCNTCEICPTGARYSPDFTFERLLEAKKIELHDETQIRKLVMHDTKDHIIRAEAVNRKTDEPITYEAGTFIVTSGYAWSSHLLLLSANTRFPDGLANGSGLVGRYMTGHSFSSAFIELDASLFPGMNEQHSLISRQFFRAPAGKPYVRHDLRVWESAYSKGPRLKNDAGEVLFGDAVMNDWRGRTKRSVARVRAYYDVHPDRDSRLTLDPAKKNRFGDPLPKIEHRLDAATVARRGSTLTHIHGVFETLARADNGKILSSSESNYLDHPGGGCRMGTDPKVSVVDSYGLTHDHPNLWVVGSPTLPTGGCTNGTLTFVALTLRSAERLAAKL
ncbi:MAG: GMC family oxidoreductase [Vicinamibacteria bacterium]